ncbi:hypothetical protein COY17_00110 [Candidatus Saccharibacteria bacterium CG_4_10_14_0_2_um_filter_52_9]|nr:MAG: hypothetical protein COY17_00110 [Candidatus Saccharibacteria bacterium CG_4_10_14_0_2_um_filter_52_9]
MFRKTKGAQLNCFSPPVMIATMVIEVSLALYTVWRYKLDVFTRLVVLTLVALAGFQMAEYFVCTGSIGHPAFWSRMGFVAITALPPLGVHLLHVLADKPGRKLVAFSYATMAAFMLYFTLYSAAFTGHQCTGNYVIFQLHVSSGGAYAVYYYGWLLAGLGLGGRWANQLMAKGKNAHQQLQTVRALMLGWLVFLVPTALANTFSPESRRAIPSVMCGFAVLFALILSLYILPRTANSKT